MYDVAVKNKRIPIKDIVTNILALSKLEDVDINDRIIVCVDKKIRQLTKKGKEAKRKGGRQFKEFIETAKTVPYKLKV